MKWGVVRFPGSLDDHDALYVVDHVLGEDAVALWHKDRDLNGVDCVILPGGFSYGDYLRCGAIARFSPIMESVAEFARAGGLVLGICNGFQILCEAGLLPGALIRNRKLSFLCDRVHVRVEDADTPFTNRCTRGEVLDHADQARRGLLRRRRHDPRSRSRQDAAGRLALRRRQRTGDGGGEPQRLDAHIAGIATSAATSSA